MTMQMELDFSSKPAKRRRSTDPSRSGRPHHRTTILTTDNRTYAKVRNLVQGEEMSVEFCNDIISSAAGGSSVEHHSIRRVNLLRRQMNGGFMSVKVRSEQGVSIHCTLVGELKGEDDACSCFVTVKKAV